MNVGSKYELTLHPELGYGAQGAGSIPGNSVLVFEVELLGIVR
jgi:FKBP-type peptidyl-prolyl cis-trans isomerase FkpA